MWKPRFVQRWLNERRLIRQAMGSEPMQAVIAKESKLPELLRFDEDGWVIAPVEEIDADWSWLQQYRKGTGMAAKDE